MLAVQQQKRLCRQFIDVSAARRGCHTYDEARSVSTWNKRLLIVQLYDLFCVHDVSDD